jgi:hypothetical protein
MHQQKALHMLAIAPLSTLWMDSSCRLAILLRVFSVGPGHLFSVEVRSENNQR